MAVINFVHITNAGALENARKEVAVRKLNGGSRGQIILQFLLESAIVCIISFILAGVFTLIVLPVFNELGGKHLQVTDAPGLAVTRVLLQLGIIFSREYTRLTSCRIQTRFGTVPANLSSAVKGWFGKSLVVLQFSLAVFLLIASLSYYRQMEFIRTKNLGYNPHQVIRSHIAGNRDPKPVQQFLRSELLREPGILSVTFGGDAGADDCQNRRTQHRSGAYGDRRSVLSPRWRSR